MCKYCNVAMVVNGVTFTHTEVRTAFERGISQNALEKRIRRGMSKTRALHQPPQVRGCKK